MNNKRLFFYINLFILILLSHSCNYSDRKGGMCDTIGSNKAELPQQDTSISRTIPFVYDNSTISFNAILNDSISGEFIFDSGLTTSFSILAKIFSDLHRFSILSTKPERFYGVGNRQTLPVIERLIDTEIFGNKRKAQFGILNLGCGDEDRYAGVLNVHIFKDSIVEFDFKNKLIKFHKYFSDKSYNKINIIQRGNVKLIEVDVCISKTFKKKGLFILDTGYKGFLYYFANNNQFSELSANPKAKRILGVANFDKPIDAYSLKIPSVSIDGLEVLYPTINFGRVKLPNEAKDVVMGLVGNKFFDRFNFVIDFKRNILYLKQLYETADSCKSSLGITFSTSKSFKRTRSIIENSDAHKAGLIPCDIVSKINNICVKDYSGLGLDSLLYEFEVVNKPIVMECIRKDRTFAVTLRK